MNPVLVRHRADRVCFWFASHTRLLEPHLDSWIPRIQLRILSQQLFRLFRDHFRQRHLHFHKLMPPRTRITQRRRATIAQAKLLSRLRARRNAQLRLTFDRRHFDFRSQRRFRHRNRHRHINVVALALEVFVLADVRDDVQISRRRAHASAMALAGNTHARTRFDTCGNAHLYRLVLRRHALAVAQRTRRTPPAGAAAVRAFLRETQTTSGALHLARSLARRTNNHWSTDVARAVATRTLLGTIDGEIGRESSDRFFKRDAQRHLDVCATLWLRPRRFFLLCRAAAKQIREDVAKTRTRAAAGTRRRPATPIETREVKARRGTAAARWASATRRRIREVLRILSEAIVNGALLRIGKHVVRFRHELETLFGRF